ncbi:hypothetical protein GC176_02490 [bacterium]|nr:hypothetical protein [bacterium]
MPDFTHDPLRHDFFGKDANRFDVPRFDEESGTDGWTADFRECDSPLTEFSSSSEFRGSDRLERLTIDAEQFVIEATDLLPIPRASLRDAFIAEVAKIEQRRERIRKVPVAIAFLLLVSICVLWPRAGETRAAAVVSDDNPLDRLPLTNAGPAAVISASQKSDSWALVEAYSVIREKKSGVIRKSFDSGESL